MICGRSSVAHKSKLGSHREIRRHHGGSDSFFGLDVENMSSPAQITAALTVLVPVALGAILVLSFVPQMFWLVFVFGWMVFPSVGLLVRGLVGLSATTQEHKLGPASANSRERELLEALREYGELTPARAAMETSLSVTEADRMLKELAEGGHLDVRVRGGGLFYSLWERGEDGEAGRLEGR